MGKVRVIEAVSTAKGFTCGRALDMWIKSAIQRNKGSNCYMPSTYREPQKREETAWIGEIRQSFIKNKMLVSSLKEE